MSMPDAYFRNATTTEATGGHKYAPGCLPSCGSAGGPYMHAANCEHHPQNAEATGGPE